MSNVFTSAGTTIAVVLGLPATYDAAGFAALTYGNIGEVTQFTSVGATRELVTHNPIGNVDTVKRKGSNNWGALTIDMAVDENDAGQAVLEAGVAEDSGHSFKITRQNGTIQYFSGQVMSFTTDIGSVNSITSAQSQIELDGPILTVPAI